MKRRLSLVVYLWLNIVTAVFAGVKFDASVPPIAFAAEKVTAALNGSAGEVVFEIQADSAAPESFAVARDDSGTIRIIGSDSSGAMYGGLEVAEQIRIYGFEGIKEVSQSPYMGMRGIKFNIPLDVRTPSYSDLGDAGQLNIQNVWDLDFWKEFIDEIAAHRYNYISLWNLHPFPSLVKVPDYPGVALNDVKRGVGIEEKFYSGNGTGFDVPEILDETETLLRMTIDDKIAFWRQVMRYGKDRNVDFYFVTWNVFDYGTEGKYGIDDSVENPVTVDYFRKSVTQLFLTYPDLKGIGITTGENMHEINHQEKEDWMMKTYGLGVLDVFDTQPDRIITFLHRQHQAGASAIADTFKPLVDHPNVDFIFSYKYAKAHSYSSTKQPFYESFAKDIRNRSDDLKTIWTMRNDSTYLLRLAFPDFMREFVRNIPMELTRGYYFGSDGWIWGREFVRKGIEGPRELEIKKHWFQWMLWGRFAYDPDITNERFAGLLHARFPDADGDMLLDTWQKASMVFPLITGFHWGPLDFHWYPEGCTGSPGYAQNETGFHDVNRFISLSTHPGSGYVSIPDYVEEVLKGADFHGTGPVEISAELMGNAEESLSALEQLRSGDNAELTETLKDIEAMAYLNQYYAYKISGSTQLHLYRETGDKSYQDKAITALENASITWRKYTSNILDRYMNPIWYSRIRTPPVDFEEINKWVDQDIEIARTASLTERN